MRFGVITFLSSNCDHDCYWALKKVISQEVKFVWHKEEKIDGFDCLILLGGFSWGDYLRTGAIAKFSPVIKGVEKFAQKGRLILGICNGFQILQEIGLLPGVMLQNESLCFICEYVYLKVENEKTPFTSRYQKGEVLKIPIAYTVGNFFVERPTLQKLKEGNRAVLRYCDKEGRITRVSNPNGAMDNIAAVINDSGNVLGMMPHPERCVEPLLGSTDGRKIFESIISGVADEER